jgi:hypothetical protein
MDLRDRSDIIIRHVSDVSDVPGATEGKKTQNSDL